ncbi:MAG TPA: type II toxin-antitoxin system VapB family antitoxin [Candidatus Dormibacteraeota bacterium]|nr:type II toxin-antitoxin system VapB family antitoxin [Candidatus Dormibacteraeota bacterium]
MNLNIKSSEAHQLARSVSRETGETLTEAVTTALRERLERLRARRKEEQMATEIDAIAKRGAELFKGPYIDHADLLYDENGLPK